MYYVTLYRDICCLLIKYYKKSYSALSAETCGYVAMWPERQAQREIWRVFQTYKF